MLDFITNASLGAKVFATASATVFGASLFVQEPVKSPDPVTFVVEDPGSSTGFTEVEVLGNVVTATPWTASQADRDAVSDALDGGTSGELSNGEEVIPVASDAVLVQPQGAETTTTFATSDPSVNSSSTSEDPLTSTSGSTTTTGLFEGTTTTWDMGGYPTITIDPDANNWGG